MRWTPDLKYSDITPQATFLNRRQIMAGGLAGAAAMMAGPALALGQYDVSDKPNSWEDITTYNNYYEFGTGKGDPAKYAKALTTDPWSVKIEGMVDKPGNYDLADILQGAPIEERIYRLRCVEAWSMVVPWNGFQLSHLLDRVGVQPGAKYVSFETLVRPDEMRGQRKRTLQWPYREGLRLDEAMNPLTLLATGIYGKDMPNQNGAPLRLVVPWKYGFKSIKSIVSIKLTDKQPETSWNIANPGEYGFYSNVNPDVSHPRWSQSSERRIGGGLFAKRVPTQMFNGYGEHVAAMYQDMDLSRKF
ncbi:protein-methionine-sulfoxide reductase catalytic subunit MsrP [Candidatus Halocynthiibacter alkanivorans]|uniref:protein-methionine-sulfoxide reductase catalytic subunit MsrP n=1 Tax=Candidatus Halocynthiibacter alkanivorans TaxID=2267619 RepID=UPI000DF30CA6|nr:protein-methionine-sulfoxide reductase catalytic subunit MsrP [Candidatus Halocynthiibacter alkanivorans]